NRFVVGQPPLRKIPHFKPLNCKTRGLLQHRPKNRNGFLESTMRSCICQSVLCAPHRAHDALASGLTRNDADADGYSTAVCQTSLTPSPVASPGLVSFTQR